MKPWNEIPTSALAGIDAVACDFDDTLTTHHVLDAEAATALHALRDHGIPCVIATGRPLGWGSVLARILPVRAVNTENGNAWIVREGSDFTTHLVDAPNVVAERLREAAAVLDDVLREFPNVGRVKDMTARTTDLAVDVGESVRVERGVIDAVTERIRARGLHVVESSIHLHVSPYAPDKLAGLERVAAAIGLDATRVRTHWVFVGDSANDAGAFGGVDHSVGVANVRDFIGRLAAEPKFVTVSARGRGFAEVAHRLCTARGLAVEPRPR